MKGYLLANLTVLDPVRYARYREAAPAVVARFGGRYLVRGPQIATMEGGLPLTPRFVIIEFPSVAQAHAFYDSADYRAIVGDRQAACRSDVHIMEGCIDPAALAGPPST